MDEDQSVYAAFRRSLAEEIPVALATAVSGHNGVGSKLLIYRDGTWKGQIGSTDLTTAIAADATRLLRRERAETVSYAGEYGDVDVFIDVYPVPPSLVIVGATPAGIVLSYLAKVLGFRVVVTDARAAFAVPERFPDADAVLKGWPQDVLPTLRFDDATFVVLLSHDPKFDQPTLEHVLPTRVPYIGAIGSRKTQRERFQRLREQGFNEEQLSRIHGPVGLDLGGETPEETALAIMAEITAVRRGRTGGFMKNRP